MNMLLQHSQTASELKSQFVAARSGSILAPLTHLGVLAFSGEDAQAFLQGQLTCDVAAVGLGASSYGAYCSPQGRMLASFLLWREETGFLMALSRDILPAVRKRVSMFVLRSKVKITDVSESLVLFGVAGARAAATFRGILSELPAAPNEVRRQTGVGTSIKLNDERFFLALAASSAAPLRQQLADSLKAVEASVWRWLDVRSGVPLITAATQDRFVPQMANLDLLGAVSFSKGCYTGQEIVARVQHLGKPKRRMFLANVAAEAAAGDDLYSEDLGNQANGMIVNAEASPDGGYDALAVAQIASRKNSTVHLKSLDGPALRFLPLPYPVA
jgi:tRNA-modifying protein YgfZ